MAGVSTWSGMRNKLENNYLCPALRGRIQYFATSYWESHDQTGRAAIRLDGVEVLRSPMNSIIGTDIMPCSGRVSERSTRRPPSGWPMKGH